MLLSSPVLSAASAKARQPHGQPSLAGRFPKGFDPQTAVAPDGYCVARLHARVGPQSGRVAQLDAARPDQLQTAAIQTAGAGQTVAAPAPAVAPAPAPVEEKPMWKRLNPFGG